MAIYLKTEEEISLMRAANRLVGSTLGELAKIIKPGVSTGELNRVAEELYVIMVQSQHSLAFPIQVARHSQQAFVAQ